MAKGKSPVTEIPKLRQAELRIERLPEDPETEEEAANRTRIGWWPDPPIWRKDRVDRLVFMGRAGEENVVDTVFTTTKKIVGEWVDSVRGRERRNISSPLVAGIALYEGSWNYRYSPWYKNRVLPTIVAISICVGGSHCLLYVLDFDDVLHPRSDFVSRSLREFLGDAKVSFVGFGVKKMAAKLKEEWGAEIANPIEARTLASVVMGKEKVFWCVKKGKEKSLSMKQAKMEEIVAMATGLKLDEKPVHVKEANWADDVDEEMIMHAAADALVSFQVGEVWLKKIGRPI